MELSKDWSDVVAPPGSGDPSCGSVLDSLKPLHQAVGDEVH